VRSSLGDRFARTFFIVVDEEIILLHGIIKKVTDRAKTGTRPRPQPAGELYERIQKMKTKASRNAHRGGDFSEFLAEEGILAEVEILALKRVVALQLQQILEHEKVTKTQLAARMKTSRASLDRILDPTNPSLTVASLGKAAAALGRKVELRFVPA